MRNVILVDDDRTNATLIKALLEMDGFDVLVCPDGASARALADSSADAFVIDHNLAQGENGIQLLTAIRNGQTGAISQVPVVITSGDDRLREPALQAGATRFFLKPFSPGELSSVLQNLLQ